MDLPSICRVYYLLLLNTSGTYFECFNNNSRHSIAYIVTDILDACDYNKHNNKNTHKKSSSQFVYLMNIHNSDKQLPEHELLAIWDITNIAAYKMSTESMRQTNLVYLC